MLWDRFWLRQRVRTMSNSRVHAVILDTWD